MNVIPMTTFLYPGRVLAYMIGAAFLAAIVLGMPPAAQSAIGDVLPDTPILSSPENGSLHDYPIVTVSGVVGADEQVVVYLNDKVQKIYGKKRYTANADGQFLFYLPISGQKNGDVVIDVYARDPATGLVSIKPATVTIVLDKDMTKEFVAGLVDAYYCDASFESVTGTKVTAYLLSADGEDVIAREDVGRAASEGAVKLKLRRNANYLLIARKALTADDVGDATVLFGQRRYINTPANAAEGFRMDLACLGDL